MALVWTHTASPAIVTHNSADPLTFAGVAIGTAAEDRYVIVAVGTGYRQPSGVTIGGSAATQIVSTDTSLGTGSSLWGRLVTTGTTADIVVTPSEWTNTLGIHVGTLTGANTTATATQVKERSSVADPQTVAGAITIPTGGIGIVAFCDEPTLEDTLTWAVETSDGGAFTAGGNSQQTAMAHYSTAGSWTASVSGCGFSLTTMAAATFEPAAEAGGTPGSIVFTITL